jgi:4-carboxymuconolactone decarboxylase
MIGMQSTTTPPPAAMRVAPLAPEQMTPAQRSAADALIAGPRKGIKGPFIALLRSPELLARVAALGEFLRFSSTLAPRVSEFATLIVARAWSQQFEWHTHVPLALKAGTAPETIAALREGTRPATMDEDESLVHDFATELLQHHGVGDATYARAVRRFGEAGVVELTSLIGYFAMVSMVLNVAHTPEEANAAVQPLEPFPR